MTTNGKTEVFKFTGKALWAKVYEADEFRGSRNFTMDLEVDKDNLALYKKAGIQGKVKENENGPVLKFKRPETKLIKGVATTFAPPKIVDKDGNPIVEYKKNADGTGFDRIGDPVLIGNGSIVEVAVSVYPTSMGNGQRLESIRVIDLIEYRPDGNGDFEDRIVATPKTTDAAAGGVKGPW